MAEILQNMIISLIIVFVLLIVVYLIVIMFGFININAFLIKQDRYKNYFMLSFYTMAQICLIMRLI